MVESSRGLSAVERVGKLPLVVGAMLAGVLTFGAAATSLSLTGSGAAPVPAGGGPPAPPVLAMVLAVVTASGAVGYFAFGVVAKGQAARAWAGRGDDAQGREAVAGVLMTTTVVRAALAEGFGLLGGVLIMLEGNMLGWVSVGLCTALLAGLMPARSRLEALEEGATGVRAERRFGGGV